MQKSLTQMNLQLANVISDLSGVTGQKIVRAIVAGERNPRKLAELSDPRIQASKEEIKDSSKRWVGKCEVGPHPILVINSCRGML
jgi:transposase